MKCTEAYKDLHINIALIGDASEKLQQNYRSLTLATGGTFAHFGGDKHFKTHVSQFVRKMLAAYNERKVVGFKNKLKYLTQRDEQVPGIIRFRALDKYRHDGPEADRINNELALMKSGYDSPVLSPV